MRPGRDFDAIVAAKLLQPCFVIMEGTESYIFTRQKQQQPLPQFSTESGAAYTLLARLGFKNFKARCGASDAEWDLYLDGNFKGRVVVKGQEEISMPYLLCLSLLLHHGEKL